jgi:hypothetical protein
VASTRHFLLWNRKLVALPCPEDELTLSATHDLAGDGIIEESVPQSLHDLPFELVKCIAELGAACAALPGIIITHHFAVSVSCSVDTLHSSLKNDDYALRANACAAGSSMSNRPSCSKRTRMTSLETLKQGAMTMLAL